MPQGKGILYPSPGYGYMALNHLLLNDDFEIKDFQEQPALNLILGGIMERQVAGQSLLLKLVMGDSFNSMATRQGDSAWDANPGTPYIVDATITPRKIVSRFQEDGDLVDNIKAGSNPKYTLEQMLERYLRHNRNLNYRLLAGDGSGRICWLGASSATAALALVDEDGSTSMGYTHPAWKHLFMSKHVDVVLASTGLAIEGGADLSISSLSRSGRTCTVDATLGTITGSKTYYLRFHTPASDSTDTDYVTGNSLLPEPQGLAAAITAAASYLGYSNETYPDWNTPTKDCDGKVPSLALMDELVAQMDGLDGIAIIGDSAITTQIATEATAKGQMDITKKSSIYEGVKDISYQSIIYGASREPIPLLTAPEFNNSRRLYFVNAKELADAGATLKPKWRRPGMVVSEAYDYVYNDMVMNRNMYTSRRNRHGLLYNCGAAYGWNAVTA
jgi:hypothetical protein